MSPFYSTRPSAFGRPRPFEPRSELHHWRPDDSQSRLAMTQATLVAPPRQSPETMRPWSTLTGEERDQRLDAIKPRLLEFGRRSIPVSLEQLEQNFGIPPEVARTELRCTMSATPYLTPYDRSRGVSPENSDWYMLPNSGEERLSPPNGNKLADAGSSIDELPSLAGLPRVERELAQVQRIGEALLRLARKETVGCNTLIERTSLARELKGVPETLVYSLMDALAIRIRGEGQYFHIRTNLSESRSTLSLLNRLQENNWNLAAIKDAKDLPGDDPEQIEALRRKDNEARDRILQSQDRRWFGY